MPRSGRGPQLLGWGRVAAAVLRRPGLWWVALRQARVLTPPGWAHRRPYLPIPDAGYLRFRALTQYGDAAAQPVPADVVTYLQWCRGCRD